eukprot:GCRY01004086.1.p1 GENE.GCRY01004086.1~~GCRY01004086.1.p1  ORF type:complete len:314 (-),score=57.52 GCRY01004086.1:134-1075(-)
MFHENQPIVQAFSGVLGSMTCGAVLVPLDVIKTRLQSQLFREDVHTSFQMFRHILKTQSVHGLWKGLLPTVSIAAPSSAMFFVLYEGLKNRLGVYFDEGSSTPAATAGVLARVVNVAVGTPLEMVRTCVIARPTSQGFVDEFRFTVHHSGVASLWRGCMPTLLRDVPFSAMYWGLLEGFKQVAQSSLPDAGPFVHTTIAGSMAGGIAAFLTTPFDTIKTHVQLSHRSTTGNHTMLSVVRTLLHPPPPAAVPASSSLLLPHSVRVLFTGVGPRVSKSAFACTLMITTYEEFKRHITLSLNKGAAFLHLGPAAAE